MKPEGLLRIGKSASVTGYGDVVTQHVWGVYCECVVKELELKMSTMFKITVEPQSLKN